MATYNIERRAGESDLQYYRRLAKTADQRLVRLEKLATQEGFQNVTKWAYARAMKDIQHWTQGGIRFNTAPPKTSQGLYAKIADIQNFLQMKTTGKRDILDTYKKRADAINKKYGTNFTWQNIGSYYESTLHETLSKHFGSLTEVRMIGELQKNLDNILDAIKNNEEVNIKVEDKQLKKTIEKALKTIDINWEDLK